MISDLPSSYIYVIAYSTSGPCKIGYAKKPLHRLKALQTGQDETLVIHHTEQFPADKVCKYERCLHKAINHLRQRGEWFRLSVEEAIGFVRWAAIAFEEEIENGTKRLRHPR